MAQNQKPQKSRSPLQVGNKVIIRTVTHYQTGEIIEITDHEVVLITAAWVAETGRWTDALTNGTLVEVEPFPGEGVCSVARGAIVDVALWEHDLPQTQK